MSSLELLAINVGAAVTKATFKIWLDGHSIAPAGIEGALDMLKEKVKDYRAQRGAKALFENLTDEIGTRLEPLVETEFPSLQEHDREAAYVAVSRLFDSLDLATEVVTADVNSSVLETRARARQGRIFHAGR
ncbi:hypothetical protein AB4Y45_45835 [Paraburkholderia sp. EG287A]|uniref:NACHT N-terminal Helical domain 1-containing protein n=1 Tax=unclassified Paraburkholderia TaxID=2615204 RepID=UPI0034D22B26